MPLVDPLFNPERFNRQAEALMRNQAVQAGRVDPFDVLHARLEQSFEDVMRGVQAHDEPVAPPPAAAPHSYVGAAHGTPWSATTLGVPSQPLISWGGGVTPPTGIPSAQFPIAPIANVAGTPISAAAPGSVGPDLEPLIGEMSAKYEVPAWLVRNVIRQESGGNPSARSPVGALGLMQLMPGTAAELGVHDPLDPRQNVEGGVKYLRKMLNTFGGDMEKAVAAYNAGPGSVQRYGGVPPFAETQNYVRRILG